MLLKENLMEFIFTVIIICCDLAVLICCLLSGILVLIPRKIGEIFGNKVKQAVFDAFPNSAIEAEKTFCKILGKKYGTKGEKMMYILCILITIPYLIAFIMGIIKLFKSDWCCQKLRWILIIIGRIIIFILAFAGTLGKKYFLLFLAHYEFYKKAHDCFKGRYDYFDDKIYPWKYTKKLITYFIIVLIFGLIGTVLDCIVSILYRRNAAPKGSSHLPDESRSVAPSGREMKERNKEQGNNNIQGEVVNVQRV